MLTFIQGNGWWVDVWVVFPELDRENPDFPPHLISHGQKIGSTCALLTTCSEVVDCVCAALQVRSAQCA